MKKVYAIINEKGKVVETKLIDFTLEEVLVLARNGNREAQIEIFKQKWIDASISLKNNELINRKLNLLFVMLSNSDITVV